jgi:protein-disulfide isomerase
VYYILVLLLASLIPATSRAQNARTVDPAMTKGPAQAPVTIVEFSDYQ